MKRLLIKLCLFNLLLIFWVNVFAQNDSLQIDSLKKILLTQKEDTNKVKLLRHLSFVMRSSAKDSALFFAKQSLKLSQALHWNAGIAYADEMIGNIYVDISNKKNALEYYFEANKIFEVLNNQNEIASNYTGIGIIFLTLNDVTSCIDYYQKALKIYEDLKK